MTGLHPRPIVARTRSALDEALTEVRGAGKRLALVPTMGALHPGHLTLFDRAATLADIVAVSIFVNPLQFSPREDFTEYPRDLDRDLDLSASRGVAVVFVPETSVIYPDERISVRVSPGPLGDRLCGAHRPGHFEGVLTVVAKLFGIVRPAVAVFGRKDLQQAILIRRMVRDLELGVEVEIGPLVREVDGLAMSSRNAYLSDEEREQAIGLPRALESADELFRSGEPRRVELLARFREVLAGYPRIRLQYADLVDPETLESAETVVSGVALAAAAFVGQTRIIDNLLLGAKAHDPRLPATTYMEATR